MNGARNARRRGVNARNRSSALLRAGTETSWGEQGSARVVILVVACFLLGIGVSAFWFSRRPAPAAGEDVAVPESTRALLQRLQSLIEIRFYSILDPASVPEPTRAYAQRVDQLLSHYERDALGKIRLTRFTALDAEAQSAASADGLKPFNIEKGDACYLGIVVAGNGKKEPLPQLEPEWEAGLGYDLNRAIARVLDTRPAASPALAATDTNTLEDLKHALPNLEAVSVEEGTRVLREAALKDFKAAAEETEGQIREAQQRLSRAQNGASEAEQQAALKHLQQIQAAQADKLKEIAAKSKAQIDALRRLKAAGP